MFKLISGSSNETLAAGMAKALNTKLTNIVRKRFSDGETFVSINESLRGKDCFIIQSTCQPVNDNLMELLIIIDAIKRSSAKSINVVTPYFGYARQDRKSEPRTPITAKLVADMIEKAGAHRLIVFDVHAPQIQGFFNIPVDNIFGTSLFVDYIKTRKKITNPLPASPDAGGVVRARAFAKAGGYEGLAIIDKRREKANVSEVMNVIGNVVGKDVIIIDDLIDTGGTLLKGASAFKKHGAKSVSACITHGVLSGAAFENFTNNAQDLDELVITDTIPLPDGVADRYPEAMKKITVISVADLLAQVIKRMNNGKSVTSMFDF